MYDPFSAFSAIEAITGLPLKSRSENPVCDEPVSGGVSRRALGR
jgi:hypothetical protein